VDRNCGNYMMFVKIMIPAVEDCVLQCTCVLLDIDHSYTRTLSETDNSNVPVAQGGSNVLEDLAESTSGIYTLSAVVMETVVRCIPAVLVKCFSSVPLCECLSVL